MYYFSQDSSVKGIEIQTTRTWRVIILAAVVVYQLQVSVKGSPIGGV